MSHFSLSAILALLFAVPLAFGGSDRFLAAKTLKTSEAVGRVKAKDDMDDDEDDDSVVNAFTPVSEAEEVETNGDDAEEAEDVDADGNDQDPDETEPEEVGFDNAAAETESANEEADEETGSETD